MRLVVEDTLFGRRALVMFDPSGWMVLPLNRVAITLDGEPQQGVYEADTSGRYVVRRRKQGNRWEVDREAREFATEMVRGTVEIKAQGRGIRLEDFAYLALPPVPRTFPDLSRNAGPFRSRLEGLDPDAVVEEAP